MTDEIEELKKENKDLKDRLEIVEMDIEIIQEKLGIKPIASGEIQFAGMMKGKLNKDKK